jgi:hypothetical protein
MAFPKSYDCKETFSPGGGSAVRVCMSLFLTLACLLNSNVAFGRCGVAQVDPLVLDIQELTGYTVGQLILMPTVRIQYDRTGLTTYFGNAVKSCTGPECNRMPNHGPQSGGMAIVQDGPAPGPLLQVESQIAESDDCSDDFVRIAWRFVDPVVEQPRLRPPIL